MITSKKNSVRPPYNGVIKPFANLGPFIAHLALPATFEFEKQTPFFRAARNTSIHGPEGG